MSSVTFPTAIGGDGSTVTDDDNATTGLRNGGWRTRFIPCFTNLVNIADYIVSYTAQTSTFAEPPPMGSTTPNTGAFTRVTVTGSTAPANGLYLPAANSIGFATNSTERVRIDSSGNVGIGTSSPDIFSRGYGRVLGLSSASSATIEINAATGSNSRIELGVNAVRSVALYTDNTTPTLASIGALPIAFETNGSERMRLDSSGNLLVGTTSAAQRLTVKGTSAGALSLVFNASSAVMVEVNGSSTVNGVDGTPNASGLMRVWRDSGNLRSISAAGSINASGADYAEYMIKAGDFEIAKGDVCGVNANGLLTNVFSEAISFVVKSTDPSYVGNDFWGAGIEDQDVLEEERQKVDRIAFAGQVPVNVFLAKAGDYIIPVVDADGIKGEAISNPTFEQYQIAVGKVIAIETDGRAKIIVKVT